MKTYKTVKLDHTIDDYQLNNYSKEGWNLEHFSCMSMFNGTDPKYIYIFAKECI